MRPEIKLTAGTMQGEFTCCDTTNPSVQMKQLYGHQISGMFGARRACTPPSLRNILWLYQPLEALA